MRRQIWLRAALAGALLFGALPTLAQEIAGRASVIDGDTLEIHGVRIRLFGIDAPEGGQTCRSAAGKNWRCGTVAARKLDELTRGKTVRCAQRDIDRYGRVVAVCIAGGRDVSAELVEQGLAVAYRRYSHDYIAAEERAREKGAGIWAGPFEIPQEWRKKN